jgi:hypothetical protein
VYRCASEKHARGCTEGNVVALLEKVDGCPFADVHYNKICSNNRASFYTAALQ